MIEEDEVALGEPPLFVGGVEKPCAVHAEEKNDTTRFVQNRPYRPGRYNTRLSPQKGGPAIDRRLVRAEEQVSGGELP